MVRKDKGKGNCTERDEWQTPKELFDKLNKQYGFTFDCCANLENRKTEFFASNFLKIDDGSYSVMQICWMNPPFSKAKDMFEHFFKIISKGISIYRCDNMETKVWQDIILKNATWIFIPKGRVNYEGMDGNGSVFPSALIGYNVEYPENIEGTTLIKLD